MKWLSAIAATAAFAPWTVPAHAGVHFGIEIAPPPVYYNPAPPAYYVPPPVYYGPGYVYGERYWDHDRWRWRDRDWERDGWRHGWHDRDDWRHAHDRGEHLRR